ncbi:hypothetical protein J7W19_17545 [Streptomyces mobaraensis NBRC 13819 = DSM 40847]|uniref:hypothetical protein n=1 Tax=Streptomyces mobaraensis TaxID=35621 RepID=UPI00034B3744|nr:hypothetical protein [Streptomyces mobaraensis]QTT74947.1 hypothetical protein J7W19_17545 [Streptomyces mobaraensis NBRC 13819 = DSM 40847]
MTSYLAIYGNLDVAFAAPRHAVRTIGRNTGTPDHRIGRTRASGTAPGRNGG